MRLSRFACLLLILSPLALFVGGCSGSKKTGDVTGVVKLDGKELPLGTIRFLNPLVSTATGTAKQDVIADIEDGTFKAVRVPVGDIKVTIDTKAAQDSSMPQALFGLRAKIAEGKKNLAMLDAVKDKPGSDAPGMDPAAIKEEIAKAEADLKKAEATAKKVKPAPPKYGDAKTSGLSFTIKSGSNDIGTIDLVSK